MSRKNSNDTIGNRTCDLPACSAVPQPTAPPCAPRSVLGRGRILYTSTYFALLAVTVLPLNAFPLLTWYADMSTFLRNLQSIFCTIFFFYKFPLNDLLSCVSSDIDIVFSTLCVLMYTDSILWTFCHFSSLWLLSKQLHKQEFSAVSWNVIMLFRQHLIYFLLLLPPLFFVFFVPFSCIPQLFVYLRSLCN